MILIVRFQFHLVYIAEALNESLLKTARDVRKHALSQRFHAHAHALIVVLNATVERAAQYVHVVVETPVYACKLWTARVNRVAYHVDRDTAWHRQFPSPAVNRQSLNGALQARPYPLSS